MGEEQEMCSGEKGEEVVTEKGVKGPKKAKLRTFFNYLSALCRHEKWVT